MKKFICWYAFCGMETEGRVELEEPQIYEAEDVAEAMWKYRTWLLECRKGNDITKYYKDLETFRKSKNITGWGFRCEELAN